MKNKKNIYFLLPAVLIIWGILIYKVIVGLNPSTHQNQTTEVVGQFIPKTLKQSETFTLKADYRDPFLGTIERKRTVPSIKKRVETEKITIPFPTITFKGIVSPKGKNEEVFLILVNGQQHLFKKNSVINNVKLLSGNSQEIKLQFQDQKQTFQLAK